MKQSALKSLALALAASTIALMASTSDVLAGPIYTFATSVGTQPANVGLITLTQNGANSVDVSVDLLSGYGFVNTGGPHTPFAFNLAGSESGLSISFTTPSGGNFTAPNLTNGVFSLNTAGGDNTPYGTYGVAIDKSLGNGSPKGYFGDLLFTLTRTGGLSTDDFITNGSNYYFSADLSNGADTGAQAWALRTTPTILQDPPTEVPEPFTMSLFAAGLAGVAGLRRRKSSTNSGAAAA
jgi:hypothetical protein